MPSWGVGIFRESDGTYITIDFENAGIKKFGMNSIGTTLMVVEEKAEKVVAEPEPISQTTYVPVNAQNGALIQYDGESGSIAGKNIIRILCTTFIPLFLLKVLYDKTNCSPHPADSSFYFFVSALSHIIP